MWKTLIKLRFRLTWNYVTKSVWRTIGTVIGLLYMGAIASLAITGMIAAGWEGITEFALIIAFLFIPIPLGWLILPLAYFGVDPAVDPKNYAVFVAPFRRFSVAMLAQAAASPGTLVSILVTATPALYVLALGYPLGALATLAGMILMAYTCITGSRLLALWVTTRVENSAKLRAVTSLVALVMIFAAAFGFQFIPQLFEVGGASDTQITETFTRVVETIAWLPLLGIGSIPRLVIAANWPMVAWQLVSIAIIFAALLPLWHRLVTAAMLRPDGTSSRSGTVKGADLTARAQAFARYLPLPAAAVAARELRYWRSDSRYVAMLASFVFLTLMGGALSFSAPSVLTLGLLYAGCAGAGSAISASAAMDSTAWWMHTVAPIRGVHDRVGRIVALSVIALPFCIAVGVALPYLLPDLGVSLAQSLTLALSGYLIHCGFSSVESVALVFPMKPPGESIMTSNTAGFNAFSVLLSLLTAVFFAIAVALPMGLVLFIGGALGIALSWVITLLILIGFTYWGGSLMDRRRTIILSQISAWPGHRLRL